jgi:hypothetical protein
MQKITIKVGSDDWGTNLPVRLGDERPHAGAYNRHVCLGYGNENGTIPWL